MAPRAEIAIIGGSGFYDLEGLSGVAEVAVDTPFGPTSDRIVVGRRAGRDIAFLPRHGRGHRLAPSEVPSRANIYALKSLGVSRIVAVSAVGSMREEIHPLDLVIPDQLIDRTRDRPATFFGDGLVAHVGFADPYCAEVSAALAGGCASAGARHHRGGSYVCIEGPQFSTRAESRVYRGWGAAVIGMTAIPEARLAREAEICYGLLALATDYDVWHEEAEAVSVEMVVANVRRNVATARRVVTAALDAMPTERRCACGEALRNAIMTRPDLIPEDTRRRLGPLVEKYLR